MNGMPEALAPVHQVDGVPVVVLHHVPAVGLHRVGARALVEHRADAGVEVVSPDALDEVRLVEVVRDLGVREVGHLVARRLSTATMSVSPRA